MQGLINGMNLRAGPPALLPATHGVGRAGEEWRRASPGLILPQLYPPMGLSTEVPIYRNAGGYTQRSS